MKDDVKLIPNEIESISCVGGWQDEEDKNLVVYSYKINGKDEHISIVKLESGKRVLTDKIIDDSNEFVNGFKVVGLDAGDTEEYGYVRESDNVLLPYRFDVAGDFNEHGLAMVARDGKATWMNKNFELLTMGETMLKADEAFENDTLYGFQDVYSFSEGEEALSRVVERRQYMDPYTKSYASFGFAYVNTEGEFKKFYEYDGEEMSYHGRSRFTVGSGVDFKDNDYVVAPGYIFFKRGSYIPTEQLRHVCSRPAILDLLENEVSKTYDDSLEHGKIKVKM